MFRLYELLRLYGCIPAPLARMSLLLVIAASAWIASLPAAAQGAVDQAAASPPRVPAVPTLNEAFSAAWQRQPEAQSLQARQEADTAQREAATSWAAAAPELELATKTDRVDRNQGAREYEAAVAVPLWLPGERQRSAALADAQSRVTSARLLAAQLQTAAAVRQAYWAWQQALIERSLASERLTNARTFAADVARRVKAGDLARADLHRAEGAAAAAESAAAESAAAAAASAQQLRALTGLTISVAPPGPPPLVVDKTIEAETEPQLPADIDMLGAQHPLVANLLAQAEVARRAADLAGTQRRGNPELTVGVTRERGQFGESYQQALTVGVRIPFGSNSRYRAKVATANAEALEAESQLQLQRDQVLAELEAARQRVEAARLQREAAEKRERLAAESRGFFEKSFRLGETDLPTRLQIELEAAEAKQAAARARIELASAISGLRQALGLLP